MSEYMKQRAREPAEVVTLDDAARLVAEIGLHGEDAVETESAVGGRYEGTPPKIELLPDGRLGRLLSEITFIEADGDRWPVPVGATLDGASIPRVFWSVMGGPFEGRYRDASIVHDHYCVVRTRPWRDTHRMFHDAMRVSGVGATQAKIMYYAVQRFGPRWPDELEGAAAVAAAASGDAPRDADAASVAMDAEAIALHDLSVDAVERLADARAAEAEDDLEATEAAPGRVRRLVVVGGGGTQADLDAVARAAAGLPEPVVARFERTGVRVVACRGSVTDFERRLRGVVPRGWESTGRTWDDVPGAYFPDRLRVVIATVPAGGGRAVPGRASGLHGSSDLVIHECLHGYDYGGDHAVLGDPGFVAARNADMGRLGAYERQAGRAGLEETFAESGARFQVEPAAMAADWRALHGWWAAPPDLDRVSEEAVAGPRDPDAPIGTAYVDGEGAIRLDLRAEDAAGAIGHALIVLPRGTAEHDATRARLFGDAVLEGAGGTVLVRA